MPLDAEEVLGAADFCWQGGNLPQVLTKVPRKPLAEPDREPPGVLARFPGKPPLSGVLPELAWCATL